MFVQEVCIIKNKGKSTEIFPLLLFKQPYIHYTVQCMRTCNDESQKGQQKVSKRFTFCRRRQCFAPLEVIALMSNGILNLRTSKIILSSVL